MAGGSNYLDGEEGLYGLSTIPTGLAEQASSIIDAYLKRPEGLVYVCDKNGNPAFMRGLSASFNYKATSVVSPGSDVAVTVSPANLRPDVVGEVLVLEHENPDALEAVVVKSIVGKDTLVLQTVQFAHAIGTELAVGMVITEERTMPTKRSIARYTRFPCGSMLSMMGRYAYGRRSDQMGGLYQEMNLLAAAQTFGGPPQWIPIPIDQCSWSDASGEVWVPAGMLLAYYSDVKFKYVAGFTASNLPDEIIQATARLAQSMMSSNMYGANIQTVAAGDARITRFNASYVDEDVKKLLDPYKARLFF